MPLGITVLFVGYLGFVWLIQKKLNNLVEYIPLNFFNFDILQHVYGIFLVGIVFRLFFALLKTSDLSKLLKIS